MTDGLRHDDLSLLRYNPSEYKVQEIINTENRRGLVLARALPGRQSTHTVLLGKAFAGDDNLLTRTERLTPAQSRALAAQPASSSTVFETFVLNKRAQADVLSDPGSMDDESSEMYGHVPVACTCDDWKWRGVKHELSRGSVGRTVAKNNLLDRFYRQFYSKRTSKHYTTATDLAASKSGCRHMVWVSRTWRHRSGKVPRARRFGAAK